MKQVYKMITRILIFNFLLSTFSSTAQISYTTVANGPWSSAASWSVFGVPPNPLPFGDTIVINNTIVYDVTQRVLGTMIVSLGASISGANDLFIGAGGTNMGELINYGDVTVTNLYIIPDDCLMPYAPVDPYPVVNNFGTITATNEIEVGQTCGSGSLYNFPGGTISAVELEVEGYLCNQDSIFVTGGMEIEGGTVDCCGYIETPSVEFEQNGLPDRPGTSLCQTYCTSINTTPFLEIDGNVVPDPIIYTNPFPDHAFVDTNTIFCGTALPVQLVAFSSVLINHKLVNLEWSTASEIHNDYFTIERSLNGRDWEFVADVESVGTTINSSYYETSDIRPYYGISYYRLTQTDIDGRKEHFDIRSIENNAGMEFNLYPNPAKLSIYLRGPKQDVNELRVYSLIGNDVTSELSFEFIDVNTIRIDLRNVTDGVYLLRTPTETLRFIKE